ncbi:alpha/beta fold hydrolase [Massilia endophytica]|uniref:alpha/beta fold hydrolase n=1 Tax=Massilia endophytica TaxID=2899220 RepID=UPI001E3F9FBF|nr:alpha/beta fold hydrolase [Massilia endophytica]UGQ48814.1 alpha/beta hydrolase [Massilia endophytica]
MHTKKFVRTSLLLLALGMGSLLCNAQALPADAPKPGLRIGGYALDMQTAGSGPYTVIFESGFAGDLSVWRKVAPALSKSAKVVVYSRAGVGKSDARPEPRTLEQSGAELEQMVKAAELKPPFILVGHSYGGFLVRQFAAHHPAEVAGMVFVDASAEGMDAALKKIDATRFAADQKAFEGFTPAAFKAEYKLVQQIFDAGALPQGVPLPDVPTVVLTSAKVYEKPEFLLHTPSGMAAWRLLHEQFFRQFSNGSHVVTSNSGHYIQLDEPELVIRAVEQVIASASAQAQRKARKLAREGVLDAVDQAALLVPGDAESMVSARLKASQLGEADINAMAYELLRQPKRAQFAPVLMKFNVETHPDSANAYDSYGEALLAMKQPKLAKTQFQRALSLGRSQGKDARALAGYEENMKKAELADSLAQ